MIYCSYSFTTGFLGHPSPLFLFISRSFWATIVIAIAAAASSAGRSSLGIPRSTKLVVDAAGPRHHLSLNVLKAVQLRVGESCIAVQMFNLDFRCTCKTVH